MITRHRKGATLRRALVLVVQPLAAKDETLVPMMAHVVHATFYLGKLRPFRYVSRILQGRTKNTRLERGKERIDKKLKRGKVITSGCSDLTPRPPPTSSLSLSTIHPSPLHPPAQQQTPAGAPHPDPSSASGFAARCY